MVPVATLVQPGTQVVTASLVSLALLEWTEGLACLEQGATLDPRSSSAALPSRHIGALGREQMLHLLADKTSSN